MALGQRLHPGSWKMPSMCDEWTVADVFAHLAGDFDRYRAWLNDALEGNAHPPFARGELAADNERLLHRYANVPGPDRLRAVERAANDYIGALESVDTEIPQGNPLGTMTVGEQVVWATVECAIHGWDVARALHIDWSPPACVDRPAATSRERRPAPL